MAQRRLDPSRIGTRLDRLLRAAWALCGSREDAEDLVQETYARVLARPRFLRGDDDLADLLRVLRRTFLNQRRPARSRPRAEPLPGRVELAAPGRDPSGFEPGEIFDAIAGLPPDFRDAIVAVDVAGLSYGEAAKLLGVPDATVMRRLYRARQGVARGLTGGSS